MIIIRPAQPDDLDLLYSFSGTSPDSIQSKSILKKYCAKGSLIVMDGLGAITGFIVEQVVDDEAELIQIVVSDSFRRKGIACAALQQWHKSLIAKRVQTVFLEVRSRNLAALSLYRKLGYQKIGVRKNYYHVDGGFEDASLMKIDL
jgi:[ribosomal protein S18]-alanine N-acetyltransferase